MGLGVGIDEEHSVAQQGKGGRNIKGGRGLPHSAFLVSDRDDQGFSSKARASGGIRVIYENKKIKMAEKRKNLFCLVRVKAKG
jgi:hypothetical protein